MAYVVETHSLCILPSSVQRGCWRYYTHLGFSFHFVFIIFFGYVEDPLVKNILASLRIFSPRQGCHMPSSQLSVTIQLD
jgi:hypothetical protein